MALILARDNPHILCRYDDALKIYDSLLETDDSNCALYKRKIAVLRSQNKMGEAIKQLNEYLKKFVCDQEGWAELCQLYQAEQDWSKAGFCMEELIMSNPHNHLYLQQYAEILYTGENLELAKTYFSQALKLCPSNSRALRSYWLLSQTCSHLAASPKTLPAKRKEHQKVAQWCANHLSSKYQISATITEGR
ncbi:EMC2 [Cordylochernes scorpioides]|uniref:ER membrane protein complex subunit 2 n=1 Tax=Cordylochernes scorpioides TaxID=51811 RepID=A0ABY6LBU8_9ARAC|nr:EMC2 [Cordylochernes scorpioides]